MNENLDNLFAKAEHLVEVERPREAIPLLLKILAQEPEDFHAVCMLSLCHYALGDYKTAREFAEKAIGIEPEEEWGHRLRSVALGELGKKKEALKSAEEAVRLAPFEIFALQTLANAYLNLRKTRQAEQIALKMRENFPESEAAVFTLGNVCLQKGDNFEAEKYFREALRLNPNSADARNNLGVALLRQTNAEDTKLFIPSNLSILNAEDEVHKHFTEAVKLEPNHELAAGNLKSQFSYFNVFYTFLVFLPFLLIAFIIAPALTFLFSIFWFFGLFQAFWEIRSRRKELSPEMKAFLKSSSSENFKFRLREFSSFARQIFGKTWKPHVLAVFALIICFVRFGETIRGSTRSWNYILAYVLIIVSTIWLTFELKKD